MLSVVRVGKAPSLKQAIVQPIRLFSTTNNVSSSQPPIRALIIGSPGSGKGTLSKRLLKSIPSLQYLSAGDLLRHERQLGTELGRAAEEVMRKGTLMPDETMMKIIDSRVRGLPLNSSWLLDGFPRTRIQAVMFDGALKRREEKLDIVLHLDVPNEVVLSRILDRWIHEPSGRTYNLSFNPPKVPGKDDVTGEDLTKRIDDDAKTFEARLNSYEADTKPMVDYFSNAGGNSYVRLQGTSSDEIWPRMLAIVKQRFGDAVKG